MSILRPPLILLTALIVLSVSALLAPVALASPLDDAAVAPLVVELEMTVEVCDSLPEILAQPVIDTRRTRLAEMLALSSLEPVAQRVTHSRSTGRSRDRPGA